MLELDWLELVGDDLHLVCRSSIPRSLYCEPNVNSLRMVCSDLYVSK